MHPFVRFAFACLVLSLLVSASQPAFSQDAPERRSLYDTSGRYVYASYFQIPWSRVDSLIQINTHWNTVTEKGREIGCYLDREFLIHQTGDEYNVVFKTYYKDWASINAGCNNRDLRAAVPDSLERAALNAGGQWVFDGASAHRDIIYWEPFPDK